MNEECSVAGKGGKKELKRQKASYFFRRDFICKYVASGIVQPRRSINLDIWQTTGGLKITRKAQVSMDW